jgi:DNA modification methylase
MEMKEGFLMDYKSENVWLMQGDCLERMKELPDGSIDLTVTSPPYDNLRTYNGNNALWGEHVWKATIKDLYRVTKDGGVVVWIVADATINGSETGTSFKQALWAMECGFRLHDTMIWRKTNPPPQVKSLRRYTAAFEYMFVWSKGAPASFNVLEIPTKNAGAPSGGSTQRSADGSYDLRRIEARKGKVIKATKPMQNVWDTAKQGQGALHPAQFPEKLAHDHILSWSNHGDTVFDPFMGSGTTGVACINTNRNFIGIELDQGYFDIACKRIEDAQRQAVRTEQNG